VPNGIGFHPQFAAKVMRKQRREQVDSVARERWGWHISPANVGLKFREDAFPSTSAVIEGKQLAARDAPIYGSVHVELPHTAPTASNGESEHCARDGRSTAWVATSPE